MRLISYRHLNRSCAGRLDSDGRITPLRSALDTERSAMRQWLESGTDAEALQAEAADRPQLDEVVLEPLVPDPHAVWCAAGTYRAHVLETGAETMPDHPPWFLRIAESLCAAEAPLIRPLVSQKFDYEGELAMVIGRAGRHVREADAMDHVAGFTCFNDGSVRDWQRHSSQIGPGKNFARTGALGPWMVTREAFGDPYDKRLETRLNGQLVQSAPISDLMFSLERMIAYLSTIGPLKPGDIIATGTCAGVGNRRDPQLFMQPGDTVEVTIDGIGTLRNPIVEEHAP